MHMGTPRTRKLLILILLICFILKCSMFSAILWLLKINSWMLSSSSFWILLLNIMKTWSLERFHETDYVGKYQWCYLSNKTYIKSMIGSETWKKTCLSFQSIPCRLWTVFIFNRRSMNPCRLRGQDDVVYKDRLDVAKYRGTLTVRNPLSRGMFFPNDARVFASIYFANSIWISQCGTNFFAR